MLEYHSAISLGKRLEGQRVDPRTLADAVEQIAVLAGSDDDPDGEPFEPALYIGEERVATLGPPTARRRVRAAEGASAPTPKRTDRGRARCRTSRPRRRARRPASATGPTRRHPSAHGPPVSIPLEATGGQRHTNMSTPARRRGPRARASRPRLHAPARRPRAASCRSRRDLGAPTSVRRPRRLSPRTGRAPRSRGHARTRVPRCGRSQGTFSQSMYQALGGWLCRVVSTNRWEHECDSTGH